MHLSRPVAAGLEYPLHAAAVQPDGGAARPAVRDGCWCGRSPVAGDCSGDDGRRPVRAPGRPLPALHRIGQPRAERNGPAALDGICEAPGRARCPAGRRRHCPAPDRRSARARIGVGGGRGSPRPLSVLRQRRSDAHGDAVRPGGKRGRMRSRSARLQANLKRMIGLDIRADEYAYAVDPVAGYISAQKVPDRWVKTTCGYCSVGCGMFIGVKDGRAVAVRGNPDHPVSRGLLCPKGLSEHHTIDATNRAKYPLLRLPRRSAEGAKAGAMTRVSWSEAIDTMATRFREVQEKYGRQAVGVISTGQLVTEEFYTLGKLVQLGIRTSNYDGNTTLCMSTAVAGYKRSFGSDGPPAAYEDFDTADVILLIGANIADNHPILCRRLQSNPHKTLVVVDPRVTKTAMLANLHLPIRPRADLALLNALIHVVIEHDLVDREYIERHTSGFDALRESVREYTPDRAAEITGLAPELIYRTAWLYANADRALIAWTMGVNHSTKGTETVNRSEERR